MSLSRTSFRVAFLVGALQAWGLWRTAAKRVRVTEDESLEEAARRGIITDIVAGNKEAVVGLLRSKVFNKALSEFLRDSNFFEELLMRGDLLTTGLCGVEASSDLRMGMKGMRAPLGDWTLRIAAMECDGKCQKHLGVSRTSRVLAQASSVANGLVDMKELLKKDGMPELFLSELAQCPGLLKGLTPERMVDPFSHIRIRAQAKGLPLNLYIKRMRYQTDLDIGEEVDARAAEQNEKANWYSTAIDMAPSSAGFTPLITKTLAGFTRALVSEPIAHSPAFPKLLNALLSPLKMDLTVYGAMNTIPLASASSTLKFQTDVQRNVSMCP